MMSTLKVNIAQIRKNGNYYLQLKAKNKLFKIKKKIIHLTVLISVNHESLIP